MEHMVSKENIFISRHTIVEHMVSKENIFISRHTIVAGYYGFMLDVRVSVRPSVVRFSFPDDNE